MDKMFFSGKVMLAAIIFLCACSAVNAEATKKAGGVTVTRLQMQQWKPTLSKDGSVECIKGEKDIRLKNKWMEVIISKTTGEILSIIMKNTNVLNSPACERIKDVKERQDFGPKDAVVLNIKVQDSSKEQVSVIIEKKYGDDYSSITTFTMDGQALAWDVVLKTGLDKAREAHIDFNLPLLSSMTNVFTPTPEGAINIGDVRENLRITYRAPGITVVPSATVYNDPKDFGLTLVGPFDMPKPGLFFKFKPTDEPNSIIISNFYLRLSKEQSTRAAIYIVAHEGDWRPGLAWMLKTYPKYFYPVSQRVLDGEGWYASSEIERHNPKESIIKRQAQYGATWNELHYTFPFYGMYVPDKEEWDVSGPMGDAGTLTWDAWENNKIQVFKNSHKNMRSIIDTWHKYGVQTYLYFQNFECWIPYADKNFPEDVVKLKGGRFPNPGSEVWYNCRLMNPDPNSVWGKHITEQIKKVVETYPKIDGIFLDRDDYCNYDFAHDDGISMDRTVPCSMIAFSQEQMNEVVANTMHSNNMGIWANGPQCIEVCRGIDGVMSEAGNQAYWLQYVGIVRPMILLPFFVSTMSYDINPEQTEIKLKIASLTASFPSVSGGGLKCKKLEAKFKNVFLLVKNRKWVLYPRAMEISAPLKGNIYQSPNGDYIATVVDFSKTQLGADVFSKDVSFKIRVPDAKDIKYCYLASGDYLGKGKIDFSVSGDRIDVKLPYHLVNSFVIFSKQPRFEITRMSQPTFVKEKINLLPLNVENFTGSKKNGILRVSADWMEKEETQVLALNAGESKTILVPIKIPTDVEGRELEFSVEFAGKTEVMTAWIVKTFDVDVGAKLILKNDAFIMKVKNNTDELVSADVDAQIEDGNGSIEFPSQIVLKPYEVKKITGKIKSSQDNVNIKLLFKFEGGQTEMLIPAESAMVFSKNDLFHDDFSSGDMKKWTIRSGKWDVKGGCATGKAMSSIAIAGDPLWDNYRMQAMVQIKGSSNPEISWLKGYIYFRVKDDDNFYRFGIHGDAGGVDLYVNDNKKWKKLGIKDFQAQKDKWYKFNIEADGGTIKCYVDDELVISVKDKTLLKGGIGIGVLDNDMVAAYKDIIVKEIKK